MLKLISVDTLVEKAEHEDSIDELLKFARHEARRADLSCYRERLSYNDYRVQVWSANPTVPQDHPRHLYNIEGITRESFAFRSKMILDIPKDHPGARH